MNPEQIEAELVGLDGKAVIIITPVAQRASLSLAGDLKVIVSAEHTCGFHISNPMGWGFIFYVEDVQSLEAPSTKGFTKIIRLKRK